MAVRKKEKGKQETGIVIHSWKQSNQHKPLVKIQSAQVVKIQSAPTPLRTNRSVRFGFGGATVLVAYRGLKVSFYTTLLVVERITMC